MKKKTKIILASVSATAAASGILAGLYAAYRIAFHSPNATQNDDFEYRFTDQTRPMSYKIFRMIGAMHALMAASVPAPLQSHWKKTDAVSVSAPSSSAKPISSAG